MSAPQLTRVLSTSNRLSPTFFHSESIIGNHWISNMTQRHNEEMNFSLIELNLIPKDCENDESGPVENSIKMIFPRQLQIFFFLNQTSFIINESFAAMTEGMSCSGWSEQQEVASNIQYRLKFWVMNRLEFRDNTRGAKSSSAFTIHKHFSSSFAAKEASVDLVSFLNEFHQFPNRSIGEKLLHKAKCDDSSCRASFEFYFLFAESLEWC